MKTTQIISTMFVGLIFLVTAGNASATETAVDLSNVKNIVMPLERVIESAAAKLKGRVIEAEIFQRGAALVYAIMILEKNGVVREYNFDARTGGFLGERKGD